MSKRLRHEEATTSFCESFFSVNDIATFVAFFIFLLRRLGIGLCSHSKLVLNRCQSLTGMVLGNHAYESPLIPLVPIKEMPKPGRRGYF
jgi:hypothetical protein